MITISKRLIELRGHGPNFDLVRLIAASAVLISHAFPITMGDNRAEPLYRGTGGDLTLGTLAVGIFFATSGFLIAGSMERSRSIPAFAWRRAVRIWPALVTVTLLSVFVLGPLLTTDPNYFAQTSTFLYLLNIFFLFEPTLPGVFSNNPFPNAVNGSLWTLFHEVACYAFLAATARLGFFRNPILYLLAFLSALIGTLSLADQSGALLKLQQFCSLGSYFLGGVLLYLLREKAPLSLSFAVAAGMIMIGGVAIGSAEIIAPLCMPYLAVYVGLQHQWIKIPGDYSYGIYVWAFPIQQVAAQLAPGMHPVVNILIALPITVGLGVASWMLVEKPALQLKSLVRSPALMRPEA